MIPGMNLNNQDVGGTNIINTTGGSMTIHGSNGNDQRVMIDGLSTANSELAGQASNFLPNMGAVQEMAVDFSSGTADQSTSGVRIPPVMMPSLAMMVKGLATAVSTIASGIMCMMTMPPVRRNLGKLAAVRRSPVATHSMAS